MNKIITFNRLNPDTVNGDSIQIITTYTSFDTREIDKVEEYCKQNIGTYLIQKNCADYQNEHKPPSFSYGDISATVP